jgi:hypothetical protein
VLSPEDAAKAVAAKKELEQVEKRYTELVAKLYSDPSPALPEDEKKKLEAEFEKLAEKMGELRRSIPPEYEDHGWVWLFLRAPKVAKGEAPAGR